MDKLYFENQYDKFFGTGYFEKQYKKHIIQFMMNCLNEYKEEIFKSIEYLKQNITNKQKDAERYVNFYIIAHQKPPTYDELAKYLKIKKTAAYARCKGFRYKMKQIINKNL